MVNSQFKVFCFCIFILQFISCSRTPLIDSISTESLDGYKFQKLLNSGKDTIKLGPGTLFIDRVIVIPSNTTIIGNSTIISYKHPLENNLFRSNKSTNILIKNVSVKPLSKAMGKKHNGAYYLFKLLNSSDIVFENVHFDGSMNTAIALFDVKDVTIEKCSFENFGGDTKGKNYSYDGIFIGAYNEGTNKVIIEDCVFENIGTNFKNAIYDNDGDGIQTYSKNASIENIQIEGCQFRGISRRGIKIQTGNSISIINNTFIKCKVALGVPLASPSNGITFSRNTISDGILGISPNSPKNKEFGISNLEISDNIFKNISGGLRTSGTSQILSGLIKGNKFLNIDKYAIDGRISNTNITGNLFSNYQRLQHKRVKAAIYIWDNSKSTTIEKNTFTPIDNTANDIYLYPKSKDILIRDNLFTSKSKSRIGKIINKSNKNKIFN